MIVAWLRVAVNCSTAQAVIRVASYRFMPTSMVRCVCVCAVEREERRS